MDVIKWTKPFSCDCPAFLWELWLWFFAFTSVPLAQIDAVKPDTSLYATALGRFMLSAEGNVAFAFSWSTQALVLPRLARTERSGYWATSLAYGVVAPFLFCRRGHGTAMFVRAGYYESDPTTMLATLHPVFFLLSLLMVAFANIGTQGTGSYVNCMIVKSGLPGIRYKVLVIIAMFYVSILTIWGWVMENFGKFISMAAYIQGPIIGMIVVDYLIVKRGRFP